MIKVASSVEVSYSSQIDLNSLISLETSLYVGKKTIKIFKLNPPRFFLGGTILSKKQKKQIPTEIAKLF